ncbi:PREDICTED: 7-dehydrocholesterol reductase-like [Priapulus caudatus]|uniref:7-dehydrocholesterol reductase n=1 Tax=Priapulus caudatus TaxID=37621 RepID=A0ABM1EE02_PRICU|nr:PREDICTED: 7-dehydrocholesterol reductase-like [Priapulus caudatus]
MTRMHVKHVVFYQHEPTFREKFSRQFHYNIGPLLHMLLAPNICIVLLGYIYLTPAHRNNVDGLGGPAGCGGVPAYNQTLYNKTTHNQTIYNHLNDSEHYDVPAGDITGSDATRAPVTSCNVTDDVIIRLKFADLYVESWKLAGYGEWRVWLFIAVFSAWACLLQLVLGGKKYEGPQTRSGHVPVYNNCGFRYYAINTFIMAILIGFEAFEAKPFFDRLPHLAGALNIYGFAISALLYLKGTYYPSGTDYSSSRHRVFDFYWGAELYPRVLWEKVDVKLLVNSRFGIMLWQLIVWLSWKTHVETYSCNWAASVITLMQTVYIAKFFWTEDGYTKGIDMHIDRAGFLTTWTYVCLVPCFYSLTAVDMRYHAPSVHWWLALLLFIAGFLVMVMTFWVDFQRRKMRETAGNCEVCCRPPRLIVMATYPPHGGAATSSLLLASGWWAVGRHVNYFFEILTAVAWALPACFHDHWWVPFLYFAYIGVFLLHRSCRDERRCRMKYGDKWDEYCDIASWRMIPGVF